MGPAGSDIQQFTQGPEVDVHPAWGPDGRLAFARTLPAFSANMDIYVMDVGAGTATNLTQSPLRDDWGPAWSPDGSKIVFNSMFGASLDADSLAQHDIFVMDSDGSNVIRLTDAPGWEEFPSWSPDGRWIAYGDVNARRIALVSPDGQHNRVVATADQFGTELLVGPVWSPDGQWLAFNTSEGATFYGGTDIWVIRPDGTGARNLTAGRAEDGEDTFPAWSPDGRFIAFISRRDGRLGVYRITPQGTDLRRLVDIDLEAITKIDWERRPTQQ